MIASFKGKNMYFLLVILALWTPVFAEEKVHPHLEIREFKLENGMTVILKKSNFEGEEVLIRLSAKGGYAVLPAEDKLSGEMASLAAWESGMDNYTSAEFSRHLYKNSTDYSVTITPYSRCLEGKVCKYGVKEFLRIVNLQFTKPNFSKGGFETALSKLKKKHTFKTFDESHLLFNTVALNTQTHKADYTVSKAFFEKSFKDPSEFICVIVGDFDENEIRNHLQEHLASIPKGEGNVQKLQFSNDIPLGAAKTITHQNRADTMARFTYPLQIPLTDDNIFSVWASCKSLQIRLKKELSKKFEGLVHVNVGYEIPFHPYLEQCWLTIHLVSDTKVAEGAKTLVLTELNRLLSMGPTDEEVLAMKQKFEKEVSFFSNDNPSWVCALSQFYLLNWDPSHVQKQMETVRHLDSAQLHAFLKQLIAEDKYTLITSVPK